MIAFNKIFPVLFFATLSFVPCKSQMTGGTVLPLQDLGAFREPVKGWQIVSGATAEFQKAAAITPSKGSGALIYTGGGVKSGLVTTMEAGDLELELDFLLAKNTQAALLLQGKYPVILNDSWGIDTGTIAPCGAIGVGAAGTIPPSMNVGRAPGLWQHLRIKFRAPANDTRLGKAQPARFDEVVLNGTTVQLQVAAAPVGETAATVDLAVGPLVFQASGPVVFTNIRYRPIRPLTASVNKLSYTYYKGDFPEQFPDLAGFTVSARDTLAGLTGSINTGDATYALDITGQVTVPAADQYSFALLTNGLGRLYIDDKLLIDRVTNRWNKRFYTGQVDLAAGSHRMRLVYVKNVGNGKPGLALTVKTADSDPVELHVKSAAPVTEFTDPVVIKPVGKPYLLRSFLDYGPVKLTHTISVGDPRHINYSYDLKQGALIQVWRGDFVDVTNMWVQRGEPQLAQPLGSLVKLSDAPALAVLDNNTASWPDSIAFDDIRQSGYVLDRERSPTFEYAINGASVRDKISIAEDGKSLQRELTVSAAPANFYCRLAVGQAIEQVGDGIYRLNSPGYYIRVDKRLKPTLRQTPKGFELLVPVDRSNGSIAYYITW